MRFSVFTPTHDPKFLADAYESLLAQTEQDWEWILVTNNGCVPPDFSDDRVRITHYDHKNVGALKWHACQQAKGDWVVEFDHDDMLMPTCLEEIGKSSADFVYSNCVQVNMDWSPVFWDDGYGWIWRPVNIMGHDVFEAVSPDPWPSNLSRIWFAPNHVRAWRRDFYMVIGGHDEGMHISDDHDLVARSFLAGTVEHIDKPLYVYRVHGENTWLKNGDEIDKTMWDNHDKYYVPMVEKWARDAYLDLVDLGGAINPPAGYKSIDRHNADIVCDLNGDWKLGDQSVGLLRAHDIIEHLKDPIHTMNEAWRVLAHGGLLDIMVPSTNGVGAFCDPTHVSYWNARSFRYYTEAVVRAYIEPECFCRFQVVKLAEVQHFEGIPYVHAQLQAVHDGPRIHGALLV